MNNPYDTFWPRVGAALIDFFVTLALLIPVGLVGLLPDSIVERAVSTLLLFLPTAYRFVMHWQKGATFGKMAVGVRVVREKDVSPIGWREAALRELPTATLLAIGLVTPGPSPQGVSFAWAVATVISILASEKKLALHDRIAGTVVVRTEALEAANAIQQAPRAWTDAPGYGRVVLEPPPGFDGAPPSPGFSEGPPPQSPGFADMTAPPPSAYQPLPPRPAPAPAPVEYAAAARTFEAPAYAEPAPSAVRYGYAQHPDRYATTWRRFFASIIDSLIVGFGFGLFGLVALSGVDTDYPFALNSFASAVVFAVYTIAGHGLWGGTPGKLMLGVRVVTNDPREGPIGMYRACIRAVPQAAFALLGTAILMTVQSDDFEDFLVEVPRSRAGDSGTFQDADGRVYELNEDFAAEVVVPIMLAGGVSTVGFFAYVAPLAFTRPRRSLGDLVAGTRMVRKEFEFVTGGGPGPGPGNQYRPMGTPSAPDQQSWGTYKPPSWEELAGPRNEPPPPPTRPKDPQGW